MHSFFEWFNGPISEVTVDATLPPAAPGANGAVQVLPVVVTLISRLIAGGGCPSYASASRDAAVAGKRGVCVVRLIGPPWTGSILR
jgi:hypothetical protein